jgi:predicted dehydrogenase
MKTLRFGLIGCGMMGREFASAAARWFHLPDISLRPEIVAICHRTLSAEKNNWYLEILGTKACAKFSTNDVNTLEILEYTGGEQRWQKVYMEQEVPFKSITHNIFQFGITDAILQMWAGFLYELDKGKPLTRFSGCVKPEETTLWHRLFTAALKSHETGAAIAL